MRLLVTGGAGFLGSHLTMRLLEMGHEVIVVDDLSTGDIRNLESSRDYGNFTFFGHDVIEPLKVEVEGIFNLASPASPVHYQSNPVKTLKTNVVGTMNLLELAKDLSVRFIQASTSEIYGDPQISPQIEEYWGNVNPIGVRSCYDEGKRAAETLTFDYRRQYSLDSRVVRIFNTYGPRIRRDDGRVVSNFINQALSGRPLHIYGDGLQIRSLCYVDDLIEGLISAFFITDLGEPLNLGNPEPVTMIDLAREIITLTESGSELEFHPLPSDDPRTREPDITRAQVLLGWTPTTTREVGLEKTIEYFRALTSF